MFDIMEYEVAVIYWIILFKMSFMTQSMYSVHTIYWTYLHLLARIYDKMLIIFNLFSDQQSLLQKNKKQMEILVSLQYFEIMYIIIWEQVQLNVWRVYFVKFDICQKN